MAVQTNLNNGDAQVNTQVYNQVAQVYNQKKMRQKKNGTQGIQSQQNEKEKKEKNVVVSKKKKRCCSSFVDCFLSVFI